MDATKSLQERYDALASISSTRDFFIAFADYMDFIGSKPSLARIVRKISMQGDLLREKLKNASSKALDRISEIKTNWLHTLQKIKSKSWTSKPHFCNTMAILMATS